MSKGIGTCLDLHISQMLPYLGTLNCIRTIENQAPGNEGIQDQKLNTGRLKWRLPICQLPGGLARRTVDGWDSAMGPKVAGTWNLHRATAGRGAELDFFLLLSSFSGVLRQPGRC